MLTADTITDAQIEALRAGASDEVDWRSAISICEASPIALGRPYSAVYYAFGDRRARHPTQTEIADARARLAEIINARASKAAR